MEYTTVVAATASRGGADAVPRALRRARPWASTSCYGGQHALCVYDDLSKQADAYRQMSLLLRRPPGREAFPGDVFYLHSRLLERAGKLTDELGGGSLTALPIIETQAGDVSAYIPTNVISITDGQIFLESKPLLRRRAPGHQRRHLGQPRGWQRADQGDEEGGRHAQARPRPVPRTGGLLAVRLRPGRRHPGVAGPRRAHRGDPQPAGQYAPWPVEEQVAIIYAANQGMLDKIPVEKVPEANEALRLDLRDNGAALLADIRDTKQLSDETAAGIQKIADNVAERFTGTLPVESPEVVEADVEPEAPEPAAATA